MISPLADAEQSSEKACEGEQGIPKSKHSLLRFPTVVHLHCGCGGFHSFTICKLQLHMHPSRSDVGRKNKFDAKLLQKTQGFDEDESEKVSVNQ